MAPWTEDRIFKEVQSILADALEVSPRKIIPESLVINDLGAESIDFLDISFRLETAFKISVPPESLSLNAKEISAGKANAEQFTVQMIVDFVKGKLETRGVSS